MERFQLLLDLIRSREELRQLQDQPEEPDQDGLEAAFEASRLDEGPAPQPGSEEEQRLLSSQPRRPPHSTPPGGGKSWTCGPCRSP